MARLSINEMTTYRWTLEQDLARYAEHGISEIGVWRSKLSDCSEERGIDLLAESGLAVSNLMWAGGFTGSDGRSYRESILDAEDAVSAAAAMRAGCLIVYTGGRNGHTLNHARRLALNALAELAHFACDLDVTLAVEPMHAGCAEEWTILTELNDALKLVEEIGSSHLRIVLDTYHVGFDRCNLPLIADNVDKIAVVHLGDGKVPPCGEQDRCPLGDGIVPLEEIVQLLTANGYQGAYDVELLGQEIELLDYDDLVVHSKRAFDALLGAATNA